MEAVRLIALFFHILGVSALLGGFLAQLRGKTFKVSPLMAGGADGQILTGIILVAARVMQDLPLDHTKITVKLVVALAVAVLAHIGRRKDSLTGLFFAAGILTVVNIGVAVFWQ